MRETRPDFLALDDDGSVIEASPEAAERLGIPSQAAMQEARQRVEEAGQTDHSIAELEEWRRVQEEWGQQGPL